MAILYAWIIHNLSRTIGVVVVGLFLIGLPFGIYKAGYGKGYTQGYKTCIKENPTYTVSGGNNTFGHIKPEEFFIFKIWKVRLAI